ncbi:DUF1294 domain-containing protein [Alcanivorax sp. 24]|uniref:DUF1294 domain-containing protein n=1 Tax=Alcanivorax sp. 24 TaxID=2545266 RepID=UPI001F102706|nr:DUF1294 domain-containing protein [Alcanivorax sp. 24]
MNRFLPALLVVVAFFVGLAILASESERRWFVGFYALMSVLSFSLYGLDRRASVRGGWRTPEARLHLVELLGGWPGALLAQWVFRHKTRKTSFQVVFYLVVAANLGALGWLLFVNGGPGWPLLSGLGEGLRDGL